MLFNESIIRKLNNLSLVATKKRPGIFKGERRSTKQGTSIEFADYRDYTHGDDLRRLDWNIYARLDRPFIKLLEEEEDLAVYILIDVSASMNWGKENTNKLIYALFLASAFGTIAMAAGDRLKVQGFQNRILPNSFGPLRGTQHQFRFLTYLEDIYQNYITSELQEITELNRCLHLFTALQQRPGLVLLISDMFSPTGYQSGLSDLAANGYELVILHTLSPDEVLPELSGDLRLLDYESEDGLDVSVDRGMRETYLQRLSIWKQEIRQNCVRRGFRYFEINTGVPWEKIVLQEMRKANLVR